VKNPEVLKQYQQVQDQFSAAMDQLLKVARRHPEIKTSQNYVALWKQLRIAENSISVERKRFNELSKYFNTLKRIFPNVLVAKVMGLQEKAYFQSAPAAGEGSKADL